MTNVITERTPSWMIPNVANTAGTPVENPVIDNSVFETDNSNKPVDNSVWSGECDDGKDDGKLSFGSAAASTLKGIGKSLWNTVKGIVTDPKKLVLAVATTALCIAFPPAGVALGAVGVATGLYNGGKAVVKAVELYNDPNGTDAEAKAAFEDIGASTLQVGLSVVAVKGSLGAMKATQGSAMSTVVKSSQTGIKGVAENTANYSKAFFKDTVTGGRGADTAAQGYKMTQTLTSMKSNMSSNGGFKATKGNKASGAYQSLKSGQAFHNAKSGIGKTFNGARATIVHPITSTKAAFGKFSNLAKGAGYSSVPAVVSGPVAFEVANHNMKNSNIERSQYEQYQKQMASYANGYNTDFTQLTSGASHMNYDFGVDYSEIEAETNEVMTDFITNI